MRSTILRSFHGRCRLSAPAALVDAAQLVQEQQLYQAIQVLQIFPESLIAYD